MSRVINCEKRCALCGENSTYRVLASTSSFGSPDLDLRPPPLRRHTMSWWVEECPNCGYVAKDIEKECGAWVEDFIKGEEYLTCSGINFKDPLAARFYREYLLAAGKRDAEAAYNAILCAAWCCDDTAGEAKNAVKCRRLALVQIDKLLKRGSARNKDTLTVVKADIMRRAGEFDRLISEYAEIQLSDRLHARIIAFELEKAKRRDDGRYTVEDTEEDNS